MTKEELLRIYSAYLPYGLKGRTIYNIDDDESNEDCTLALKDGLNNVVGIDDWVNQYSYPIKPILYDLSYLTKEIEHEGNTILPAEFIFGKNHNIREVKDEFIINKKGYSFKATGLNFKQVQKLLELHFNVFDIPEGEYINKSTLTNK